MFSSKDKLHCLCFQVRVYRAIRSYMIKNKLSSILDVGCGCPEKMKAYIFPVAKKMVGLDMFDDTCYDEYREYGFEYRKVDLEKTKLDLGRTFDVIVCADVIEHIRNTPNILNLIKRHADKNTMIVMSTPDVATYVQINVNKGHVQAWTRDSFVDLLEDFGFNIENFESYRQEVSLSFHCLLM